jgi:hypothetical protein
LSFYSSDFECKFANCKLQICKCKQLYSAAADC